MTIHTSGSTREVTVDLGYVTVLRGGELRDTMAAVLRWPREKRKGRGAQPFAGETPSECLRKLADFLETSERFVGETEDMTGWDYVSRFTE